MPRAGLNRDLVVQEAAGFADDQGYDQLTLSALADRIGIRPPSLYKHVDSLDDLRLALAFYAYRRLQESLETALDDTEHPLVTFSNAYRDFATTHPGLVASTVRVLPGHEKELADAEAGAVEPLLAVIRTYGITNPTTTTHLARLVRSALHGFVTIEAAQGFQRPESIDESFGAVIGALDLVLTHHGSQQP